MTRVAEKTGLERTHPTASCASWVSTWPQQARRLRVANFQGFKLMPFFALESVAPGPVAQSVEQRIENPRVGGSIPSQATNRTPKPFSVGRVSPQTTRGSAYSACARVCTVGPPGPPGSPLFCPLSLSKPAPTFAVAHADGVVRQTTCACRWEWIWLAGLHEQSIKRQTREASLHVTLGRERIVTVAVALTDLAVPPWMSISLCWLMAMSRARSIACCCVSWMEVDGRCLLPHTPLITAVDGYDPLVLSAHFKSPKLKNQALEIGASLGASRFGVINHVMACLR